MQISIPYRRIHKKPNQQYVDTVVIFRGRRCRRRHRFPISPLHRTNQENMFLSKYECSILFDFFFLDLYKHLLNRCILYIYRHWCSFVYICSIDALPLAPFSILSMMHIQFFLFPFNHVISYTQTNIIVYEMRCIYISHSIQFIIPIIMIMTHSTASGWHSKNVITHCICGL